MRLQGATVLITGGGSGIGFELARQLIARGNTVIAVGRSSAALERARQQETRLHTLVADVSDSASIAALQAQVAVDFPALNVLVNCAGIMRKIDLTDGWPLDDLATEIDINLAGTFRMVAQFMPMLLRQPQAAIINVSSALAFVPMAIAPIYSASKAAVHAYTLALRGQLSATRIQVFELAPPTTSTSLHSGEAFTAQDTSGSTPMTAEEVVTKAITGVERGRLEITPGAASLLRMLGRLTPRLAYRLVNTASLRHMVNARPVTGLTE